MGRKEEDRETTTNEQASLEGELPKRRPSAQEELAAIADARRLAPLSGVHQAASRLACTGRPCGVPSAGGLHGPSGYCVMWSVQRLSVGTVSRVGDSVRARSADAYAQLFRDTDVRR